MTTVVACPVPILSFLDNAGNPAVGGSVLTQVGGINTATYQDSAGSIPLPNPIPLNSRGEISNAAGASCQLFILVNTAYTFTLYDAKGNQLNQATYVSSTTSVDSQDIIYDQTAAEKSLSVIPANYAYPADPYVDPRRYGADPTGVTVSTNAVQTALNVAYAAKSMVWIGAACNFLVGALSLTLTGNQDNDGIRIIGSSTGGSAITSTGSPTALLTFIGADPTSVEQAVPVVLENFSIYIAHGNTTTVALLLQGIAYFTLNKVYIPNGNGTYAIELYSAISGTIQDCYLAGGTSAIYARTDGAGSGCNLIRVIGGTISGNQSYGIDYDGSSSGNGASMLLVEQVDMEANQTAAIHIGANIAHSIGFALVSIQKVWFESNVQDIQVDNPASGSTWIVVRDCQMLSETSTSIVVAGADFLEISNCYASSPNGTWSLTASYGDLKNCFTYAFSTMAISYPYFNNVSTSSVHYYSGYFSTAGVTLTLTGVSSTETQTLYISQQAADVILEFESALTGTSNSTSMTLTGLPSALQPTFDQHIACPVIDNGVYTIVDCEVDASSGTISFNHTFTDSGTKGLPPNTAIRYRLQP